MNDDVVNAVPDRPPAPAMTEARQIDQTAAEQKMNAADQTATATATQTHRESSTPERASGPAQEGRSDSQGNDHSSHGRHEQPRESSIEQKLANEHIQSNLEKAADWGAHQAARQEQAEVERERFQRGEPSGRAGEAEHKRGDERSRESGHGRHGDLGSGASGEARAAGRDGDAHDDAGKKASRPFSDQRGSLKGQTTPDAARMPSVKTPRVMELENDSLGEGLSKMAVDTVSGKVVEHGLKHAIGELAAEGLGSALDVVEFQVEALGKLGDYAGNADSLTKHGVYVEAFANAMADLTGPEFASAAKQFSEGRTNAPTVAQIEQMQEEPVRDLLAFNSFREQIRLAAQRDALHTVERQGPEWRERFAAQHPDPAERVRAIQNALNREK